MRTITVHACVCACKYARLRHRVRVSASAFACVLICIILLFPELVQQTANTRFLAHLFIIKAMWWRSNSFIARAGGGGAKMGRCSGRAVPTMTSSNLDVTPGATQTSCEDVRRPRLLVGRRETMYMYYTGHRR